MREQTDSPFVLATRLANTISAILVAFDIDALDHGQRKEVLLIKRLGADARLDARDYELSETRAEQVEKGAVARKRFDELRLHVLRSSEYNVFSAIDVAQYSAQIDEIISHLR